MKTMHSFGFTLTACVLAVAVHAQTTTPTMNPSIRDNPGTLGHSYADLNYSWVDYHRDSGIDADGYIAGLKGNAPIGRGVDVGLGYNYYRENNHRNPFTGTPYDFRFHEVAGNATIFAPGRAAKPFLGGMIGYQWSRGDIQRLRTYDNEWVWGASAGVELPFAGAFALTPRLSFTDTFRDGGGLGVWHYGAQAHHWFNEKFGGYLDATFHDPRRGSVEWWSYTAGMRFRF